MGEAEADKIGDDTHLNPTINIWKEILMPIVAQDWRGVVIELDNNETAAPCSTHSTP
jgi:hypothetical protein